MGGLCLPLPSPAVHPSGDSRLFTIDAPLWLETLELYGPFAGMVAALAVGVWVAVGIKNSASSSGDKFAQMAVNRVGELEAEAKVTRSDLDLLKTQFIKLQSENAELRQRLEIMEGAHMDLPWPQWLKDRNGTMIAVNPAYEIMFLAPRGYVKSDYVGERDESVWPADIAVAFREHDAVVLRTREPQDFFEEVVMPDGSRKTLRFLKFPRTVGGAVVGIAGMHIPDPPERPQ